MAPRVEVYSIDECFLDLTGTEQLADFEAFGHQVRERIQQWHGIGVGVGISSTKTLALSGVRQLFLNAWLWLAPGLCK